MNKYKQFAQRLDEVFKEQSLFLCELDAKAGDGDHGITISRGFQKANEKMKLQDDSISPADAFKTIGYAMLESMGGASGPIFSTFFICMATQLRGESFLTGEVLKAGIENTVESVCDLAGTVEGEKTMVDSLCYALAYANRSSSDLNEVLQALENGAKAGSEATIEMVATKGRAKFMGERSKGFMDAGSKSVHFIMEILNSTFKE